MTPQEKWLAKKARRKSNLAARKAVGITSASDLQMKWVPCSVPSFMFDILLEAEAASPFRAPPKGFEEAFNAVAAALGKDKGAFLKVGTGRPLHCKQNVAQYLTFNEGVAVEGTVLWHGPNDEMKTEEHTVLRLPNGNLLDVTSQAGPDKEIFFVTKS